MTKRLVVLLPLLCAVFVFGANADVMINLDAQANGQALPGSNPINIALAPGTYMVNPVGIAGGGIFDAWSAWSANLNCLPDHTCEHGWETSFDYSYSAGYFNIGGGTKYDSPAEALAHAVGATFTLTVAETVSFGFNECAGCLRDNRGGNSLLLQTAVPEPSSIILLAFVCAGLGRKLLRRA